MSISGGGGRDFFYFAKPCPQAQAYRMACRVISLAVCLPASNPPDLSDDCKPRLKTEACIRFHPALLWPFHCRHCLPAISAAASDCTLYKSQQWLRRESVWPDAVPFRGFPSSLSPPSCNVLYCSLFIASLLPLHRCLRKSKSLLPCRFPFGSLPNANSTEWCSEQGNSNEGFSHRVKTFEVFIKA